MVPRMSTLVSVLIWWTGLSNVFTKWMPSRGLGFTPNPVPHLEAQENVYTISWLVRFRIQVSLAAHCSLSHEKGRQQSGDALTFVTCALLQVPCADPTGHRTAKLVMRYSTYLVPIPLIAAALDTTSWMFAVEGTLLNAWLVYRAHRFGQDQSNANARGVFKASLWHLPAVLAMFVFHSNRWEHESEESLIKAPSLVSRMRSRLKGSCIHEIFQVEDAAAFCPAVVSGEVKETAKLSVASTQEKDRSAA